jgi:branched-chain amino acid transport system ATP-binding protein
VVAVPESCLELVEVDVRFGGTHAADAVSLRLDRPVTGIVGPNGAGKTTLLNVMTGLQAPDRGQVRLDGRDIGHLSTARRAGLGIGRSFQHPTLVPMMTVAENLTVGISRRAARQALSHFGELLGLGPWLRREVHVLPYGVRKLLDLGRALVAEPTWLLCDEPLAGLDEPARDGMLDVLGRIAGSGVRLVLVEHDLPRVTRLADWLVVLDLGRKLAEGPPREALADPAVKSAYSGTLET